MIATAVAELLPVAKLVPALDPLKQVDACGEPGHRSYRPRASTRLMISSASNHPRLSTERLHHGGGLLGRDAPAGDRFEHLS